ncbi:hypothetical protein LCGC14_2069890, partial [marine sediment metagenome]
MGTRSDAWAVYLDKDETLFLRLTEDGTLIGSAGDLDLGSTSLEIGEIFVGDDKGIFLGDDQDTKIEYDEDGTNQTRVTGADWLFVDANTIYADSQGPILGGSSDFTMLHDGTDTIFDNTFVGDTIFRLGDDAATTEFKIQNNSALDLFAVDGAGVVDIDGTIDLDTAFGAAAGTAVDVAATSADADGAATGLLVAVEQITNVRTSTRVAGVKSKVTSLTGDTANVDYACFEGAATVGEANADHSFLY